MRSLEARHVNRRRSLLATLAALSVMAGIVCQPAVAGAGSGSGAIPEGTAITVPGTNGQILWLIQGQPFVYDEIFLHNKSQQPIVIQSIELRGEGIPEVLEFEKRSMAPLDPDPETEKLDSTPGGIWLSYPPTMNLYDDVPCTIQRTEPIRGYVLQPGANTRVLVLARTNKLGQARVWNDKVIYRQQGKLYRQVLPNELKVHVREPGWVLKPNSIETECRSEGNLLPLPPPPKE